MADIDRSNQEVLNKAVNIYRDCMRQFLIRNLKRVPGSTLEEVVKSALTTRDGQRLRLEEHLRQGEGCRGIY